jgi:aminobenzoyl-glutamate utilization protein B
MTFIKKPIQLLIIIMAVSTLSIAQETKEDVVHNLDQDADKYAKTAKQIWDWAEVGYQEEKSSELLQSILDKEGFKVESGVAGMPTSFIATYGSGLPVIGILAEYDALPGLSQKATSHQDAVIKEGAGHACGHHLFGTGSLAAAVAIKDWLLKTGTKGTIKLFGTPAEEGGAGKVYMVRAGLFDDVDIALHWHPNSTNGVVPEAYSLANKSAKFRFHGIPSHAAASPENGRSALDAVESMNMMVNMMREHVPEKSRIHYVITKGGDAPNIVPGFAEVYYYVRHPQMKQVNALFNRVVKAAEGAAIGTETTMDYEVIHGLYNLLPNEVLSKLMYDNLNQVGGVDYTAEEKEFAIEIMKTYSGDHTIQSAMEIMPFENVNFGGGSTDVGDVSWVVPTVGLDAATWVPGTSAHSWQAVAAGGTSIGFKGMMVAAKTISLTAIDLFKSPSIIVKAQEELDRRRGQNFEYKSLLGDRTPPLDYRK